MSFYFTTSKEEYLKWIPLKIYSAFTYSYVYLLCGFEKNSWYE